MQNLFRLIAIFVFITGSIPLKAQENNNQILEKLSRLERANENLNHRLDVLSKQSDDILWFQRVGDVAFVDKIYIAGPPRSNMSNPTAMGYDNPLKFWTYVFIPRLVTSNQKYPLIVLPHGGVHSNLSTYYTHIIRELVAQGYIVVAPEYRGSTGYGKSYYQNIDYGGLETEDVFAARNHMVENYKIVDKHRVGIIGWSHGGLISLLNIFDHPDDYQVAFAGVPVSDLIARMGYHNKSYLDLYSADYHIGKTVNQDVEEYRRRSPAWNTHRMSDTPLLIHTNTNDNDVNVLEVEHLIKSLKADGKKFEYEIYQAIPGGHSFDRIDTKKANQIRVKIYKFLADKLRPPKPIRNVRDLRKAAYRF
ncbi:MAG: alpha/beta fold hydrolase [Bacteroidales bacterium]|jgi:dipeptidyl aminopeptidase/acylaminoacyl peptidase|nr:alpha/beta fold hydrolase [Bacteroidales bacterium]